MSDGSPVTFTIYAVYRTLSMSNTTSNGVANPRARTTGTPHPQWGLKLCVSAPIFPNLSVAIPADLWYMFVLQGGEHMNKLLKDLYDCFYTPPELAATKREIEECHRALIEALGKPERRLVLKIIDAKDHISEDTSLDSFISGFRLAWRLSAELNHYDDERPARCQAAEKPGARFTLKKEDDEQ